MKPYVKHVVGFLFAVATFSIGTLATFLPSVFTEPVLIESRVVLPSAERDAFLRNWSQLAYSKDHVCGLSCIRFHRDLTQPTLCVYGLHPLSVHIHCSSQTAFTRDRDCLIADLKQMGAVLVLTDVDCAQKSVGCVEAVFYVGPNADILKNHLKQLPDRYPFIEK